MRCLVTDIALRLPDPALGTTRLWTVSVPVSWNARHRRAAGGGIYVDSAVGEWERTALLQLREQGWQSPVTGPYTLAVRFWFTDGRRDIDKALATLLDWLKRSAVLGVDDRHLRSLLAEKMIDRAHPRCEFAVWEWNG